MCFYEEMAKVVPLFTNCPGCLMIDEAEREDEAHDADEVHKRLVPKRSWAP
jgi:hypothetical protein